MIDSTNPRIMADNIRQLAAAGSGGSNVVPNPEGQATGELESLGIDGSKYSIPVYSPVNYSTSEVNTGVKDENGDDIYLKVFASTNALAKGDNNIAHNITDLGKIIEVKSVIYTSTNTATPLSYAESECSISLDITNITIHLGENYALYRANGGYRVVLYYTKAAAPTKSTRSKK